MTQSEELLEKFYEDKCQTIDNAGDNQLVIVNFTHIEHLVDQAISSAKEEVKTKANIEIELIGDADPMSYVGTIWSEKMFKDGVKTMIIRSATESILIDNPKEYFAYGEEGRKKQEKYWSEWYKKGWSFAVSYGYQVFRRLKDK